jgi:hypothetical protein
MTHNPVHAIYLGAGAIYFAGAMYYAFKNYQITKHDGFWFFMVLFTASMTGVMVAGTLWSANIVSDTSIHPYYDNLFLIASLFLFVATYTLNKKHHKVKVF